MASMRDSIREEHEQLMAEINSCSLVSTEFDEIDCMEGLVELIKLNAEAPAAKLKQLRASLEAFQAALVHHQQREEASYPKLLGPKVSGPLLEEHVQINGYLEQLLKAVDALALETPGTPERASARESLQRLLKLTFSTVQAHAEREDQILFSMSHG